VARVALEEVVRPLVIAALVTCIAISLGQFVEAVGSATWRGFWVWMAFLVSLESIHSYRLLVRRGLNREDRLRFRFVEWVCILLLVRFGMYLSLGQPSLRADLEAWTANATRFVDLRFVLNGLLALASWLMALHLARAIYELEATPVERMPSVTDPEHYLRSTMPRRGLVDRQARIHRIVAILFGGAVVMLMLSGLAQVDVQDLMVLRHSRSSGIILNLLLYLLGSFFLISQAQYETLKASWELQDVPILNKIGRRWLLWFALFLLIVGAISALLPVNYSVGLLDTIYTAVNWVVFIIAQVVFILLYAVSLLLSLILRLFSPKDGVQSEPFTPPPPPSAPTDAAGGDLAWWQFLRSLLFWLVLMGVVGYSLVHYMRDRWGLLRNLSLRGWLLRLLGMWDGLAAGARRATRRLARLRLWPRRTAKSEEQAFRYLSLRRLSPRDKVRYFYLSTLKRSAQQGMRRPAASTPLEFERLLANRLPEATDELHALTQAFIEARYTAHSITREDAGGAQAVWRRVRRLLTLRRRAGRGERE
jgi:hypothetical protein